MGGAIARGMAKGSIIPTEEITVSDLHQPNLDKLKAEFPELNITNDNRQAVSKAELVLLCVKPWLVEPVIKEAGLHGGQIVVSIAAGVTLKALADYIQNPDIHLLRIMPNTGINEMQSLTAVTYDPQSATPEHEQLVLDIFNEMGLAMSISEKNFPAVMAMASCGIAYALKFIQAGMQAGIELGIYPKNGMKMVAQAMKGAAELILNNETHPSVEIDKVCTPGGYTIKGVNTLEHEGFTSAVVKAIKNSI